LAAPKTKEEALRQMRFVWCAFIVSIPLYFYCGEMAQRISWLGFSNAGTVFVVLGALSLLSFSRTLRRRYLPALRVFRSQPENVDAVKRWMNSWTVLICIANSEIVSGFAFWMGGKTWQQSLPFFVIGSVLILSLWPRQVSPSSIMAAR
jgi:hypothetical protein